MTKDVLIKICTTQFREGEEPEPIEVMTSANYFFKNGKHYLLYEELQEGESQPTKNKLTFTNQKAEVLKKGLASVQMIFQEEEKSISYYHTPYGNLLLEIHTREVTVVEEEDQIQLKIDYELEMEHSHVADCKLELTVFPKGSKDFHISNA